MSQIIAAIDIGSSSIKAIAAKINKNGKIDILGFSSKANKAMNDGLITDTQFTSQTIKEVVGEINQQIGENIHSVYACVSSSELACFDTIGVAQIKNLKVNVEDIQNAKHLCQVYNLAHNWQLIHCIVQKFLVDGKLVEEPIDHYGVRLEILSMLVCLKNQILENLKHCIEKSGVSIAGFLVSPYTSSLAVLSEEEKKYGVLALDIGAGLTDTAIYQYGKPIHFKTIEVGGIKVNEAIASLLHIKQIDADLFKRKFGCVNLDLIENPDQAIAYFSNRENQAKSISINQFSDINKMYFSQCLTEINDKLSDQLAHWQAKSTNFGVVLTGGESLIAGFADLANEIFDFPCRLGQINLDEFIQLPKSIDVNLIANLAGALLHIKNNQFKQANYWVWNNSTKKQTKSIKQIVNNFF